MIPPLSFLGDLRPAFTAHLAERLSDLICAGTQALADETGLRAPVRCHSALLFLLEHGPVTVADISRSDGQSHQLVSSRLLPLEKVGLVRRVTDPGDSRRRPFELTQAGVREARQIKAAVAAHARALNDVFKETGDDLVAALDRTIAALHAQPLEYRVRALASEDARP